MKIKFVPQHDQMDCGPACLSMIAGYYGRFFSLNYLKENSFLSREGVSLGGISHAAVKLGFKQPLVVKLTVDHLCSDNDLPCILHWNQNHFVVLHHIYKKKFSSQRIFEIADPGYGLISLKEDIFLKNWISSENMGIAMFLKPSDDFYKHSGEQTGQINLTYLKNHLKPYKLQLLQVAFALFATSFFTLILPFFTQAIIDKGVNQKDMNTITMLLLAQVFLYIGSTSIDVIRNWITLYLGARINITIVSDFLKKILSLPILFFETKMKSDFNQRIQDQSRIENFLTSQSLITLFSLINFSVFFFILLYYDIKIVTSYLLFTFLAIGWSLIFLKKRIKLDYFQFQKRAENQESIYELINGIQEIKLNRFENYKREKWEDIQVNLFGINVRILKIDQLQVVGFEFINQLKNILVTYITAREVILGNITLGAMLSVAFIVGQMNSPVNQLIAFFRSLQEAKLSLERLIEVQSNKDEEQPDQLLFEETNFPSDKSIAIENLSYRYGSPFSAMVLTRLNLKLPEGKVTAIVGSSGSGKTTLMKLFLRFYEPTEGKITIGNMPLNEFSIRNWRDQCGVVMQDGYIFADSIERNIVCGDEIIDEQRLKMAIKTANMDDFIKGLPLGLHTKIGASGSGISGGQKQRILIARAVYKNPDNIFFDEATSALDAENERIIHDNLNEFFVGKTVLIIAHRLSTVKKADQIIVLKNGEISETGLHDELISRKGDYYSLIKNQLELGT